MYHFAVASYPGLWGREKIGPGIHCLCMCQIFTEFCENRILSLCHLCCARFSRNSVKIGYYRYVICVMAWGSM